MKLDERTHSVRTGQAVAQYGVGAMIDFPSQVLTTALHTRWALGHPDCLKTIDDSKILDKLKVITDKPTLQAIKMPVANEGRGTISFVRFPEWYSCPNCHRFQPLQRWIEDWKRLGGPGALGGADSDPEMIKHMYCPVCRAAGHGRRRPKHPLVPARFVVVCKGGHLDDFPWVAWAHKNKAGNTCHCDRLELKGAGLSGQGLDSLTVSCAGCKASATLQGALDAGSLTRLGLGCTGRRPWEETPQNTLVRDNGCRETPVVLLRGASNVYLPIVDSSLSIPEPWENEIPASYLEIIRNTPTYRQIVDHAFDIRSTLLDLNLATDENEADTALLDNRAKQMILGDFKRKLKRVGVGDADLARMEPSLNTAIDSFLAKDPRNPHQRANQQNRPAVPEEVLFKAGEFNVLRNPQLTRFGHDFLKEVIPVGDYHFPDATAWRWKAVRQIAMLHTLREIRTLCGFKRPVGQDPAWISLAEEADWLPCYEVRGEGIFLEFELRYFDWWERERREHLKTRLGFLGHQNVKRLHEYLFLHTFAHLLVKELSLSCGYSLPSLRERIYWHDGSLGLARMAGILIYTASGDGDGSLGGLVRQGRPDVFPALFDRAVESARLCSSDPVCGLSRGQGRNKQNLAACHACCLLPETSCEGSDGGINTRLDRGMVLGTVDAGEPGFGPDIGFFGSEFPDLPADGADAGSTDGTPAPAPADAGPVRNVAFVKDSGEPQRCAKNVAFWQNQLLGGGPEDKRFFTELLDRIDQVATAGTPVGNGLLDVDGARIQPDLVWPDRKVALFASDNPEMPADGGGSSGWLFVQVSAGLAADRFIAELKNR